MIPSKLPNRESGPQNQPNANVAVLVSAGAAASMVGILVLMVGFDFVDSILLPFLISAVGAESALLESQALIQRPIPIADKLISFIRLRAGTGTYRFRSLYGRLHG